jgi:hypothetical protein
MKRWLVWTLIFAATFLVGTLLVYVYLTISAPIFYSERIVQEPPPLTQQTETSADWVPEFRDLPTYDEIEYPEFNQNLLDISNNGDLFYTPEDVPTRSGDVWLTLNKTRGGTFKLSSSEIWVRKYSEPNLADGHIKVSFRSTPKSIFAVRKLRGLKPGPVLTVHFDPTAQDESNENDLMVEGFSREIELNNTKYTLRVSLGVMRDGEKVAVLVLSHGTSEQVIDYSPAWPNSESNLGHLIWAGDLDGDGKLDLYIDRSLGEEKSGTGLFLSSHALHGQLVKLAALFGHTGC